MKNILFALLAIIGGLMCWDVLDRALGGPGLLSRLEWQAPQTLFAPTPVAKLVKRLAVYEVNGFLGTIYFLVEKWYLIVILLSALFTLYITFESERLITLRPVRRGGEGEGWKPTPGQVVGAIALALGVVSSLVMPPPIPYIIATMFLVGAGTLAALVTDRPGMAWRLNTGLIFYALVCLAYKIYLSHIATLPPEAWAKVMGSVEEARAVMAQSKSYVNTIANLTLWLFAPAGFFSLVFQNLTAHPSRLVNPLASISETIRLIRTRGEE